jgi:hypothetical protein
LSITFGKGKTKENAEKCQSKIFHERLNF